MKYRSLTQIILLVISVVIIMTVIKPKIQHIQVTQQEITVHAEALNTEAAFNQELSELVGKIDNFSYAEQQALDTFLPQSIDSVAVARDIQNIIEDNGLLFQNITLSEDESSFITETKISENAANVGEFTLGAHARKSVKAKQFTLTAIGSYENMKSALRDFERNAYPLRLTTLTFTSAEGGTLFIYNIALETYSLSDIDRSGMQNTIGI